MLHIGCDYKMRQVAFASAEKCWARSFTCVKSERNEELNELAEWVSGNLPMDNPLWIESAIQGHAGNVQTTVKMAQTQGMIMATHWGPCTVVAPSSWKAGIGAGGRADKEEVKEWLKRTHPDLFDVCATQDEVDAMCLSLYGIMVSGGLHGQEG